MGCDALKEITIVIADGEKVTVQDCGNGDPKKDILFWTLCGAGGGNFGVQRSLIFQMECCHQMFMSKYVMETIAMHCSKSRKSVTRMIASTGIRACVIQLGN